MQTTLAGLRSVSSLTIANRGYDLNDEMGKILMPISSDAGKLKRSFVKSTVDNKLPPAATATTFKLVRTDPRWIYLQSVPAFNLQRTAPDAALQISTCTNVALQQLAA